MREHTESHVTDRPVLLVDDDADIREALTDALELYGFLVVSAENGEDALRTLDEMPVQPFVILLDLMMPVMDGYAFLAERRHTRHAAIPVAVVTAGSGVERERLHDAVRVLQKPIHVPALLELLRGLQHEKEPLADDGGAR
jgi:CheY-like chemotaxis protein